MLKLRKISSGDMNLKVQGQACGDDCIETNIWVGKLNGNVSGCVIYGAANTPKTATFW